MKTSLRERLENMLYINRMEEYIKWLENKIEVCLEDKDLQREHWAFCQALKKYRELALTIPVVVGQSEQLVCDCGKPYYE